MIDDDAVAVSQILQAKLVGRVNMDDELTKQDLTCNKPQFLSQKLLIRWGVTH